MMQTEIRRGEFTPEEICTCIRLTKKRWGLRLPKGLKLILERQENGEVLVEYDPPIQRQTYRSADYLVENLLRLNNAKRQEQADKVMHMHIAECDCE